MAFDVIIHAVLQSFFATEAEYWMESDEEIEADIQQSEPPPSLLRDCPPTQEEGETKAIYGMVDHCVCSAISVSSLHS